LVDWFYCRVCLAECKSAGDHIGLCKADDRFCVWGGPAPASINSATLQQRFVYDCGVMFSTADEGQVRHIQAHHHLAQHQQQVKSSAGRTAVAAAAGPAGKKLIGIRYLFPAFDERTTLLERARVWVARHDYKYFVDWTDAQLQSVDPALRPLAPITRDVYKLHMNRSQSPLTDRIISVLHLCNLAYCHWRGNDFYARQHVCYNAYMPRQFRLSVYVRPSVCLSHAWIVSKRLDISLRFFQYLIGPLFSFFVTKGCCVNLTANAGTE